MATKADSNELKKLWMTMSLKCFETLTFGELKLYQKFIALPMPGDNSGHGGLRGIHHIFTKTCNITIDAIDPMLPIVRNQGIAQDSRGIKSDFPNTMPVIQVE